MISGAPYTGIQMTTYELMQVREQIAMTTWMPVPPACARKPRPLTDIRLSFPLQRTSSDSSRSIFVQLFNGAMSGLIAQTVTYPGASECSQFGRPQSRR